MATLILKSLATWDFMFRTNKMAEYTGKLKGLVDIHWFHF